MVKIVMQAECFDYEKFNAEWQGSRHCSECCAELYYNLKDVFRYGNFRYVVCPCCEWKNQVGFWQQEERVTWEKFFGESNTTAKKKGWWKFW